MTSSNVPHFLFMVFGTGAWLAVNGVFVELPVMVPILPEGWTLASYLTVLVQCANVAPLIIVLFQVCCRRHYHEQICIYTIISIGVLALIALSIFWDYTVHFGGAYHSIPLFMLYTLLSVTDTASSVTYLPFMTSFQSTFITSYYVGEGMSGFIPSILSLAQGAANGYCENITKINQTDNHTYYVLETRYTDPRFSVSAFFGCLCVLVALCGISFYILNNFKSFNKFRADYIDDSENEINCDSCGNAEQSTIKNCYAEEVFVESYRKRSSLTDTNSYAGTHDISTPKKKNANYYISPSYNIESSSRLTRNEFVYFLIVIFWINFIGNGIMMAISTYTSMPYGNLAYHLSSSLNVMANPAACFLAFFLVTKSITVITIITILGTFCAAYLMLLAFQSPCPVLVNSNAGATVMVLAWVFMVGFFSYIKVTTGQIFRERGSKISLVWYGATVQISSLVGALGIFPFVNVFGVFKSGDSCNTVC